MLKKTTALLLLLAFSTGIFLAGAPVYSDSTSYIREAVAAGLKELQDSYYYVPEEVIQKTPDLYAKAAAQYSLTEAEARMLGDSLKKSIVDIPERISLLTDEVEVNDIVKINFDLTVKEAREAAAKKAFSFRGQAPSAWSRDVIVELIKADRLPEKYRDKFTQTITKGELVELWAALMENKSIDMDWVDIADAAIPTDAPYDIKLAYAAGLIDDSTGLDKSLTREQAAVMYANLVQGKASYYRSAAFINCLDFDAIALDKLEAGAIVVNDQVMRLYDGKFMPKKAYTREEAIFDLADLHKMLVCLLRGLVKQPRAGELARFPEIAVIGKDFVYVDYPMEGTDLGYMLYDVNKLIPTFKLSKKHQRIDCGFMAVDVLGPDYLVKYDFKKNRGYVDINSGSGVYTTQGYISEPRELKDNETVSMEAQPDLQYRKLYEQADAALKKIIKPGMTAEQKVKAIHDHVALSLYYLGRANAKRPKGIEQLKYSIDPDMILKAVNMKAGFYTHYAGYFDALCERAGIPCYTILGYANSKSHAWNLVYVNGKWLHVDTILDDPDSGSKINYSYYLKDKSFMKKNHQWTGFGYDMP